MKRFLACLSCMALLLAAGCHPDPILKVSPESLSFSQDGGSQTVKVTANYPWTASATGVGISVSPGSGEGDATVTITAAAASSTSETSGSVTFRSEGLTATVDVKQEAKSAIIIGDTAKIPFEGGTFRVDIQYNTEYTVEIEKSAQSWIAFNGTRALSSGKLEFTFAANNSLDPRTGVVTIKDKSGVAEDVTVTFSQEGLTAEMKIRQVLTDFYYAMDGPNWVSEKQKGWCTDAPLSSWEGVEYKYGKLQLRLIDFGLKGELPESLGELGSLIYTLTIDSEPDVTGTLPSSFSQFDHLESLHIVRTSMTSLRDVFDGMDALRTIILQHNSEMEGPLPESLGNCKNLNRVVINNNGLSGPIPSSWGNIVEAISELRFNYLNGKIPQAFLEKENSNELLYKILDQKGEGFDISDIEIPYYLYDLPGSTVIKNIDGTTFTFDDVIKKNRYTVYLVWASWCTFSRELMPEVVDYYGKYRQDGLEIIATSQIGGVDENGVGHFLSDFEAYKDEIIEKGYDQWYNFYWTDYVTSSHLTTTPNAEVYDQNGNIVYSSMLKYPDPVRNRFGKIASADLIPFLETLFGPAETPDEYTSTDYSRDGEVMTLQTATVGNGIDIVFMGDAYTDKDMGEGGLYETVMRQAMEEFFAIEPYRTFRNRFNVYAVKVVSPNGRIGSGYSTALGTYFGTGTAVGGNDDKCFEYALKVPGITSRDNLLVNVLLNTRRHAGIADLYEQDQSSVTRTSTYGNNPEFLGSTLRHEAGGHGFAFLADEYSQYVETATADQIAYYNEVYDKYGWFSNVDFTNDPSKIRWNAFLSDSRYKDEVGIFEGGALYRYGAWRPSLNSMMNENEEYFNAPSRWAIYQQIMKRSGEECTFEKFLEYDAVNRNAPSAQMSVKPPLKAAARQPGAPPVIIRK